MAECDTCRYYNPETRVCGAYDMPAQIARARPLLCGDAGADHRPRATPRGENATMIALAVLAFACLFMLHQCQPTNPTTPTGTDDHAAQ